MIIFFLIELNDGRSCVTFFFHKCALILFAETNTQNRFISANSGFEVKSRAKIKVLALIIAKKRENSIKYTLTVGNETAFQQTIVYSQSFLQPTMPGAVD